MSNYGITSIKIALQAAEPNVGKDRTKVRKRKKRKR